MSGKRSELENKTNRMSEEVQTLDGLKYSFTLVLSADYQMNKLPYWGESPQPGSKKGLLFTVWTRDFPNHRLGERWPTTNMK